MSIGDPFELGATHESVAVNKPATTFGAFGVEGTSDGTTPAERCDGDDQPPIADPSTTNEYETPFDNPTNVYVVPSEPVARVLAPVTPVATPPVFDSTLTL